MSMSIESAVLHIQRFILARLRNKKFYYLEDLNIEILNLLAEFNNKIMKGYDKSRTELFTEIDKPCLLNLPIQSYVFGSWKICKVSIDYHIEVNKRYYSVPYQHRGEKVNVRVSSKLIEIFLKNERIAVHKREDLNLRHNTNPDHMPKKHRYMLEWTPMRFREWSAKIGPECKLLVNNILESKKHPEQGYRACLGVLSLSKKHSSTKLEIACRQANDLNSCRVKTVRNALLNDNIKVKEKVIKVVFDHENLRGSENFK